MKRIISVSICIVFMLSASTILLAPEKKEPPLTFDQFMEEVMARTMSRNKNLKALFEAGKFGEMPREFTAYSKIVTHKGEVIDAKKSEKYWKEVSEIMEGKSLDFKDPVPYGWVLKLSDKPLPEETDFVIVVTTKFSFKGGSNGGIITLRRHIVRCIRD